MFEPGTKVYVRSSSYDDNPDNMRLVGKFCEIGAYDIRNDTYLVRSGIYGSSLFNDFDLISIDEYKASIVNKLVDFFGSDNLNYSRSDDGMIIIDGAYNTNALVDLIMKGEWA